MNDKKIKPEIKEQNWSLVNYIIHLQRFAAAGLIFSDITHELNNIIGAMLGFAQIAKMTNNEKDIRKCFDVVISCSEKAKRINSNMLSYLKNSPIDECLADINSVIQQSISLASKGFDRKGIKILFESKSIPLVRLKLGLFQHAFLNLLLDIKRNISPGEELKVTTSFKEMEKLIEVDLCNGPGDITCRNSFENLGFFQDIFNNIMEINDSYKKLEVSIAYWIFKREIGGDIVISKNDKGGTGYIIKIPTSE